MTINVAPTTNSLLAKRHRKLGWHLALAELCDNSFDAGGSQVVIEFLPEKSLAVTDNGNGCDDLERMMTPGDHYGQDTNNLGVYGVGLKDTACWLWGTLHVQTTCRDITRSLKVDWSKLAKQKGWDLPDPLEEPATDGSGTRLLFARTDRTLRDFEGIERELSYRFSPALSTGKQIILRRRKRNTICTGWKMPDLEDIVSDRFEVDGKGVSLTAGIIAGGGTDRKHGFTFSYGHRNIDNCAIGSGGHSTKHICGTIELSREWRLERNKTSLDDDSTDALADAIFARCKTIILKAESQAKVYQNTALQDSITRALRGMLGEKTQKGRRNKTNEQDGTVAPQSGKRKHKNAKNRQPGQRFKDPKRGGLFRMEWNEYEPEKLGRVDLLGAVVYLNENHPRLAHHKSTENEDAILDMCLTLMTYADSTHEERGQKLLPFSGGDDVPSVLADVLARQQEQQANPS